MNCFYSIIRICTNVRVDESIAVGLLLSNGQQVESFVSPSKKRLIANMLRTQGIEIDLNFLLKQLVSKSKQLELNESIQSLSSTYFDYLNKYANGLLRFSAPSPVNAPFGKETMAFLVKSLFKEELENHSGKASPINPNKKLVEEKLIVPVQDKVHTHYKFTSKNLPAFPFAFEIDCIGQNGALIGAKLQDFDQSRVTLEKHFSQYLALISTLSINYQTPLAQNNFYLLSAEPESKTSEQYKVWEAINKNELVKVLHPSQADEVVAIITEKSAKKFLSE